MTISFDLFTRTTPLVRQSEAAECGLACLAMISGRHGAAISLRELRERSPISIRGASLRQIMDVAAGMGFGTRALRCELSELGQVQVPAVMHWNLNHFVVLEKVTRKGLLILDPAFGKRLVPFNKSSECFTGVILELFPTKDFAAVKSDRRVTLSLGDLVPASTAFWRSLAQAILLSLFLQFFVLCAPLLAQLVIDQGVLRSNPPIILVLIIAFGLLKLFEVLAELTRSLVLQYLSTMASFDMEGGLLHHLLRLPLSYFQKRSIGDIQQRFSALQAIQNLIVNTTVATFIDGILAVTIGIVLFYYNAFLGLICVLSILIYATAKLIFLNLSRHYSMQLMVAEADKQSHFLESLRAIQALKSAGLEIQREGHWRNLAMQTLGARVKAGNLNILTRAFGSTVLGISNLAVIYFAAQQAMRGEFSVGMIVAFLAYKQQLEARLIAVLDAYFSYRLLDVNLERVSDIALTHREDESYQTLSYDLRGEVELKHVSFSYSPTEPLVLDDACLRIMPGEFVVFIGESGAGKTSLLKLLVGVLEPLSGDLLFDGKRKSAFGTKTLRHRIGVVMQDDQLLSGTIAQNIALFDEKVNEERIREVASLAAIDTEICAMQMGYSSLVGDMGTSLSGGQKQRILLARALYRGPAILILDESTSHLDVDKERQVNTALKRLNITRIMAAHRPETIAAADRVFEIKNCRVNEVTSTYKKVASHEQA